MPLLTGKTLPAYAIAFDMDGTLIHSTAVVERVWRTWADEHRLDTRHLLRNIHGRRAVEVVQRFGPAHLDPVREAARLADISKSALEGLIEVKGAKALLATVPRNRWAIVTSAPRELAKAWLRYVGIPIPDIFITAEDVANGKPDPSGYRAAAAALTCRPEKMVVFEDVPAGFEAAERAGAKLVALATTHTPDDLGDRDWITDFSGVRYDSGTLIFG